MRIYCFGNMLIKNDKLPIVLIPHLQKKFQKIEFIEANSPDDIEEEQEIAIIDTVKGIEKVEVIEEVDLICNESSCSLHDFDLGMTLKIMKKLNPRLKVKIIGIPYNYKKEKALKEIIEVIQNNFV